MYWLQKLISNIRSVRRSVILWCTYPVEDGNSIEDVNSDHSLSPYTYEVRLSYTTDDYVFLRVLSVWNQNSVQKKSSTTDPPLKYTKLYYLIKPDSFLLPKILPFWSSLFHLLRTSLYTPISDPSTLPLWVFPSGVNLLTSYSGKERQCQRVERVESVNLYIITEERVSMSETIHKHP